MTIPPRARPDRPERGLERKRRLDALEQESGGQWRSWCEPRTYACHELLDHLALIAEFAAGLAPQGCIAVQMPDNLDEPAHAAMRETAGEPAFRRKLAPAAGARGSIGGFRDYVVALSQSCENVDVWRTTYVHRLAGVDAIVDWFRSTGLRPFLNPLSESERGEFLRLYRARIERLFEPLPDGTVLFPFPRLFIVASRRRQG